jgi:hypothetical protein
MKVKDILQAIKSTLLSIFHVDYQVQLDKEETRNTQKDDGEFLKVGFNVGVCIWHPNRPLHNSSQSNFFARLLKLIYQITM